MTDSPRPLRKLQHKPVLRIEDVDAAVARLRVDMGEAAAHLARKTSSSTEASDAASQPGRATPDLSDKVEHVLRQLLEEETYALIEPDGPRGIAEHELHHEVLKKALVNLKSGVLKDLALTRGLEPQSRLDDLARQVAASYDWNEAAIARLILDYTEDPRETEGGPSTRVFSLEAPVDLSWTADRLSYVDGRYYRTDIAKWFVFQKVRQADEVLKIDGTLQTYRAEADPTKTDRLTTTQEAFPAQLEVWSDSHVALVHEARNAAVARSTLAAFEVATLARRRAYVPNAGSDAAVRRNTLHPNTIFLLDLVTHRLRGHLFRQRNPILARFRFGRPETEQGQQSTRSRKPSLRAVRFEGENLLDSPTACGLMWTEGRPLVDLTVEVAATASENDSTVRARIPIRVALEKDHVLVATGLSTSDMTLVNEVHRHVVDQVAIAMRDLVSEDREKRLVAVIRAQAENPDPEADAQLLGDEMEIV